MFTWLDLWSNFPIFRKTSLVSWKHFHEFHVYFSAPVVIPSLRTRLAAMIITRRYATLLWAFAFLVRTLWSWIQAMCRASERLRAGCPPACLRRASGYKVRSVLSQRSLSRSVNIHRSKDAQLPNSTPRNTCTRDSQTRGIPRAKFGCRARKQQFWLKK